MHLAEKMPDAHHIAHPATAAERLKAIMAREKYLLNLSTAYNKNNAKDVSNNSTKAASKYSKDILKAGAAFLAVLAYCEKNTAEDPHGDEAPGSGGTKRNHSDANGSGANGNGNGNSGGSSSRKKPRNAVIAVDTQVAMKPECDWILGRIQRYVPESKKYEVLDEDSNGHVFRVPRKNIRVLHRYSSSRYNSGANGNSNHGDEGTAPKFKDNQRVLAVYPQTTVFYPASLVRKAGKNWLVEFDDEDAGNNSVKEVPLQYVMCEQ